MLFFVAGTKANAQVSAYTFVQSVGSYTPITGGSVLYSGDFDDGTASQALPFTFTYNGVGYTQVWVSANGSLVFGAADPTLGDFNNVSVISGGLVTTGAVAGWASDMRGWTGTLGGQTAEVRSEVIGTSPNRVFVAQWRCRPVWASSTTQVRRISFQIRLLEGSNDVQIVYGPNGNIVGTVNQSAARQVGLRGATNADFNNRTNSTAVSVNASVAGTANTDTQAWSSANPLPGQFTSGLTYTWTPPPPCTGTPNAGAATGPAGVCSGANFTLSASGLTAGIGISYQWQRWDGASWVNISGATSASATVNQLAATDYRLVTTCASSGQSNNTNTVAVGLFSGSCACGAYSNTFPTNPADTELSSVTVGSMSNSLSTCITAAAGPGSIAGRYANFTTTVTGPSIVQGNSVPFTIVQGSCSASNYNNRIQLYVDWDQNGVFADSERMYESGLGTNTSPGVSGNFTVPVSALTGSTRMRILCAEDGLAGTNYTTTSFTYGEVEDYCFTVVAAPQCSGTPTAGTISSTANPVCSGANFTLSVAGDTGGVLGLSYQWYSSSDGVTFAPIAGATSASYTTSISSATWFRREITCSFGPASQITADFSVTLGGPAYCANYCTTGLYTTGTGVGDLISNVAIPTTTLANNTGFVPGTPSHQFYPPNPPSNTQTATLQAGSSYSINVSTGEWGQQGFAVWIDYNDNGTFEAPERIGATPGVIGLNQTPGQVNASASFPITLACNPPLGLHRMRVRCAYNVPGIELDPCVQYTYGEVEDYLVNVTTADPCPQPSGLVATSVTNNSVDVSWTIGCAETAWEAVIVADGVAPGSGTPVPAVATNASFSGLTLNTPYDVWVRAVCGPGLTSSWHGPLDVTPEFRVPATGSAAFGGEICGNTIYDFGGSAGNYTANCNGTAVITPGAGQLLQIQGNWTLFFGDVLTIYDGAGTGGTVLYTSTAGGPVNVITSVPDAPVTIGFTSDGSFESVGFDLTVTCLSPCSGTPNAGTTVGPALACNGTAVALSVTGDDAFTPGFTYEWESSADGMMWTPSGVTTTTWNATLSGATYYRRRMSCLGNDAWSTPIQVNLDIPTNCYCTTGLYTNLPSGTSAGDLISSVSITGATLNNNSGFVAGGPAYNFYAPNPPTNTLTAELQAGSSYTVNVSTGEWGNQGFAVWIDYNDNGVYETPSERIGATSGQVGSGLTSGQINASASFPITLACNPPIGAHRMRVRCVYAVNGVDILPCTEYFYGEVEEYIVNVTAPDPCPTPSGLTLTGVTSNTVSVSWTTGCVETNWQAVIVADGAAPGTGTPVAAAATNATFTGLTVDTPYDVYVRANCLGNGFSSWVGPLDATPQALVPFSGDVTITGCGYTLYDHGGPAGNYSPGASGYAVLTPTPGNGLQITGTYDIENFFSEDFLYIYDGAGTSGTLLGVFTGSGSLNVLGTGVNTPLTVAFSSGGFFEFSGFALNVTCLPSCTGTPAPGATTASQSVVCPGSPINLGISNSLPGLGLSYIWQSSTTGSAGPWTTIATTSASTYTVPTQSVNTWYRARVNCAGSGQTGVATSVAVTMAPICYPVPSSPTSIADTDLLSVSVGTGTNNAGCATGTGAGSITGIYASYLNQPSLTNMVRGGSVPFSISSGQCPAFSNYAANMAIYIDFDQDGVFETSEEVYDAGALLLTPFTYTGTISIPISAPLGQTGMRVILAEDVADLTPTEPFFYGEVEDYVVNIVAPAVANDFPSFAVNVATGAFPTCSASQTVNLALASDSPETAGSGNDAWYAFTAQTNAVRIQVTGSSDNRVELYNGATLVASENDVTANGNETLVFDGLTSGTSYLVAVIANGAPASASVCISHLRQSGCSAPSSAFPATFTSPCQQFKSIFTSASSYTAYFDVNGTAPFDGTSVATPNTTYHPISSFVGLPPLTGPVTYQVRVDATYNLTDAAGNPVTAVVPGTFNCTRSVVAHADVVLRTQDASPNVRPANAMIAANTWLCGALYYEWTIQQFTAIGGSPEAPEPTVVNGPPTNRFLNLFPLGLVPNGIYKVNVRPIFPSGAGNQGSDRWLIIAGPAMMGEQEEEGVATLKDGVEATIASALYPNPSNGSFVNLNITGVDANVMVRVLDGMGRVVWTSNLVVEGSLNTIIAFERPLASGLYMVEMTYDGQVVTERLMVQK